MEIVVDKLEIVLIRLVLDGEGEQKIVYIVRSAQCVAWQSKILRCEFTYCAFK